MLLPRAAAARAFCGNARRAGGRADFGRRSIRHPIHQRESGAKAVSDETFKASNGLNIFFRSWRPQATARGVVVIVPGFNSHSGYYEWVAEQLTAEGLAVYAVDLRGRGRSDGERFYVEKFAEYVGDVSAVVNLAKSRPPRVPVFLLRQRAGGVISCIFALEKHSELPGLICRSLALHLP